MATAAIFAGCGHIGDASAPRRELNSDVGNGGCRYFQFPFAPFRINLDEQAAVP